MKIRVPDGMLKAAEKYGKENSSFGMVKTEGILEAALRWLSKNPIVPTEEQAKWLKDYFYSEERSGAQSASATVIEWQRRMFLAEPEVPEEVKDLLSPSNMNPEQQGMLGMWHPVSHDKAILEAYRRGQHSK